jgi:hypothetical protein
MKRKNKKNKSVFSGTDVFVVKPKVINPRTSQVELGTIRSGLFDRYGAQKSDEFRNSQSFRIDNDEEEDIEDEHDTILIEDDGINIEKEMNISTFNFNKKEEEEEIEGEGEEEEEIISEEEEEEMFGEEENIRNKFSLPPKKDDNSPRFDRIRHNDPQYDHFGIKSREFEPNHFKNLPVDDLGTKNYHKINFDFKKLNQDKLETTLTDLRSPPKLNEIGKSLNRMDCLASLHFEEKRLRELYEQSQSLHQEKQSTPRKIWTDHRWWEKSDESFIVDLKKNTKEIKSIVRSPEYQTKRKMDKMIEKKNKTENSSRDVWKYTYTKPRYIDDDLFQKHFIK